VVVDLYTDDNDRMEYTVEMPEEDVRFLQRLEQEYGELSHAGVMLPKDHPDKIKLDEFWRKWNAGEYPRAKNSVPRICMYR